MSYGYHAKFNTEDGVKESLTEEGPSDEEQATDPEAPNEAPQGPALPSRPEDPHQWPEQTAEGLGGGLLPEVPASAYPEGATPLPAHEEKHEGDQ